MGYWLNLFTGKTWQEFQTAGSQVSGFRERNWNRGRAIKSGDIFLCYVVGVKRWVGLLEVAGERYRDDSPIYQEEVFPVRFPVKPLVILTPGHGVPMESLAGQLTFYTKDTPSRMWSGHLRGSPTKYRDEDGEVIAAAIREAAANPVMRPVDPKKLERPSNLYRLRAKSGGKEIEAVVSVPSAEDEAGEEELLAPEEAPTHTEIQWRLLDLGSQIGLHVWAPKSDREKSWNARRVRDVKGLLEKLPTQFNAATNKTIENIDVLWLEGQTIVAAFEVEHTTSIYSGLLRMSDLLTMQPNLDIKLYLVGPDERFLKFKREIARPTFATRAKPLHSVCRFVPYSMLCKRLEEAKNVIKFLRPEFIDEIAELYDPAEEVDV
jgi:predicted RNA-binding protein